MLLLSSAPDGTRRLHNWNQFRLSSSRADGLRSPEVVCKWNKARSSTLVALQRDAFQTSNERHLSSSHPLQQLQAASIIKSADGPVRLPVLAPGREPSQAVARAPDLIQLKPYARNALLSVDERAATRESCRPVECRKTFREREDRSRLKTREC